MHDAAFASGALAGSPKSWNGAATQAGRASGIRLLLALTTPPIDGRSVAQCRGTAHHFDLAGRQRIDRDKMILAEVGGAAAADAVLDDADAVVVEPPDDRPARRARREAGAGNARFGKQEIAERGAASAADFLVRHHGNSCKPVGDDGQHALLGRGRNRRRLRFARGLPGSGSDSARTARRGARRSGFRRTMGLGAVTVISGSAVPAEGGGRRPAPWRRCRSAQSSSQLAPPRRNASSCRKCHGPDPERCNRNSTSNLSEAPAVVERRTDLN